MNGQANSTERMAKVAKKNKSPLKFHFINPNTDEQAAVFLAKLLPEIIYKNEIESGKIIQEITKLEKSS